LPLRLPQFVLAQQRLYPREIALCFAKLLQAFRLSCRKLKAKAKNLFGKLALPDFQLVRVHLAVFICTPRH
jgi:hypothetical protein